MPKRSASSAEQSEVPLISTYSAWATSKKDRSICRIPCDDSAVGVWRVFQCAVLVGVWGSCNDVTRALAAVVFLGEARLRLARATRMPSTAPAGLGVPGPRTPGPKGEEE